jgi:hypothetical protein
MEAISWKATPHTVPNQEPSWSLWKLGYYLVEFLVKPVHKTGKLGELVSGGCEQG